MGIINMDKPLAIFIYHDSDEAQIRPREIPGGEVHHGDDMWEKTQAFIGADFLEFVSVLYAGGVGKMLVDDNGHAKELPLNSFATGIYWANQLRKHLQNGGKGTTLPSLHPVVGRAVLFPPGAIK